MATTIVQTNMAPDGMRQWSSGLFDCCKDMRICCCATFCSGCLFIENAGALNELGCCMVCCIPPPYGQLLLRVKLRTEERIEGTICRDYVAVSCCSTCALCQEAREIKYVRENASQGATTTVIVTQPMVQPVAIQPANVPFQPVGIPYNL